VNFFQSNELGGETTRENDDPFPRCWALNTTGEDLDRFAVGTADEFEIDPSSSSFFNTPVLKFRVAFEDDTTVVVLKQPAKQGAIVPCWLTGIVPVLVEVKDADHQFVEMSTESANFYTAESGWSIVAKEGGTGFKWAYVLIGSAGKSREPIFWAQAPTGGIPAEGSAICSGLVRGASGTFELTGETFVVENGYSEPPNPASEGDRRCQVSGHFDGAEFIGYQCENFGDPNGFPTRADNPNPGPE
jgi:hypothetical protein